MRIDFGLVLGVFLELFIMIYYANTTFYPKKNYFQSIIIAVVGYAVMFIIAMFGNITINTIMTFAVNCAVLLIGYKTSISGAIFRGGILLILIFLGETLMMFLLGITFEMNDTLNVSNEKSMLVTLGGKTIYFISVLIIKGIEKRKNSSSEKSFLILMLVPIITVISIWATIGLNTDKRIFVVLCAIFVFANIMSFSLNEFIIAKNNRIKALEIETSKNHMELEEYEHLNINYEENRLFRHDLKEHLAVLKSLIVEDTSKAVEYMQKIEDMSNQTKLEKYSDNSILNILLIQKARECREKGVELDIKSTNPNINFLDDMDIIAIFSNLMNNAIESSCNSDAKRIFFDLSTGNKDFIVIKVENSCDTEPTVSGGTLRSHKIDGNNHGIGIKSIQNALNKYSGHIDWTYDRDNKLFRTIVLLNKSR